MEIQGFGGDDIKIISGAPQIQFEDSTAGDEDYWIHVNSDRMYFLWDEGDDGSWNSPYPLYFQKRSSIFDGGTLYVDASNDRVGIGTTTPSSKLNIVTGVGSSLLELEGSGLFGGGLHFVYRGAPEGYEIRADDTGGINMEASGNNKISFETSSNERMRITGPGNVGIGTTTPSAKLEVAGTLEVSGQVSDPDSALNIVDPQGLTVESGTGNTSTALNLQGALMNNSGTIFSGVVTVQDPEGFAVAPSNSTFPGYTAQPAFKVDAEGVISHPGLVCGNPPTCSFWINAPLELHDSQGVIIGDDAGTPGLKIEANGDIYRGNSPYIHNYGFGGISTFVGVEAGNLPNAGYSNTALGANALTSITQPYHATAVGAEALKSLTYGEDNTAVGSHAADSTTTGADNTAIGAAALDYNVSGNANVAVGDAALWKNTGSGNTAVGSAVMSGNTSGGSNTAVGVQALDSNTTGSDNVAIGRWAGSANQTGTGNVFIGSQAGYFETGSNKLYIDNTNTTSPLIYGDFSSNYVDINGNLYANSFYPTYINAGTGSIYGGYINGSYLRLNNSGPVLYAYGDEAIWTNGDLFSWGFGGTSNVFWDRVGIMTNPHTTFALNVGGHLLLTGGNPYKTTGSSSWYNWSDSRLKDVNGYYDRGLNEIVELNPIRYNYKADNPKDLPSDEEYVGFISQEVQKVIPEAISEDDDGYLVFDMHALNVAVINAIKELKSEKDDEVAELKNAIKEQQAQIEDQQKQIDELKALLSEVR